MLHLVMGDYQEAGEAAKPPEGGHSCERFMSWTQPLPPAGPTVGQRSWAPPVRQQGKEINLEKRTEDYRAMRESLLLWMAANNYRLEPEE
ncbi:uncharacterized protein [Equus przewalskii]